LVARELLGARLCRRLADGVVLSGAIVETEAYTSDDPACHAARGLTSRCAVMFGPPGHAYVYFIYGMYHCLNVVTEPDGVPGAVLIRGVAAEGTGGPGKLCRQWEIDSAHNGIDLLNAGGELWIARGASIAEQDVGVSGRVGISCAQERPWRFYVKDHPGVSTARPGATSVQTARKRR
jgi:DNA-3-methyladenine glycosylase